jgi:hypothetical protein
LVWCGNSERCKKIGQLILEKYMLDIEQAKIQADSLESYLRTVGKNLKHTHALEAVARMNGHKSWNTFQTEALAARDLANHEEGPWTLANGTKLQVMASAACAASS